MLAESAAEFPLSGSAALGRDRAKAVWVMRARELVVAFGAVVVSDVGA